MTKPAEHPALFSAWKVSAIRNGATQTRRPMKPQPHHYPSFKSLRSPFGVPGDLLVPLTTWQTERRFDARKPADLPGDALIETEWDVAAHPSYAWAEAGKRRSGFSLPSRFRFVLPRLRVRRVWVERVQEISEEDAIAEGCAAVEGKTPRIVCDQKIDMNCTARELFQRVVWESLYPGSWVANDWVWCCEFEWESRKDTPQQKKHA